MNPLLTDDALPSFDTIDPAQVTPAIDVLLADAEAALVRAISADVPARYEALSRVLDVPVERLQRAWGIVVHLHAVVDSPAWRDAFNVNLPRMVDFGTRLAADATLFAKTRALADQDDSLDAIQRKAVTDALRDFVLGGADLQGPSRQRYAQIAARSAELSQRFGENVLDATDAWSMTVGEDELEGVPSDVIERARAAAAALGDKSCRLTLHGPCREPIMRHARRRALRQTIFDAKSKLCSSDGPAALDNGPLMAELLSLRTEQARLLDHPNYATLSLATKMVRDPKEVLDFLLELAARARPFAQAELADLQTFATETLGLDTLQPWDRDFASERLKQSRHGVDDEVVRAYFPAPRVLDGCLRLVESLFGVQIHAAPASVWHADVQLLRVERDGQVVGHAYLDLYAREGKQAGAWMDGAIHRWLRPDGRGLQHPVAHLVCNFPPPHGERASLLTHDDVITLFHEFGHGLHHLLTQVDELALSGISGVEWDACELPSQFMENFCWEWEVVQSLSAHVDSGEPMPRALFDRLLGARTFGAGMQLLRHIEFALFDMRLHLDAEAVRSVDEVAAAVRREVSVFSDAHGLRYPNSFTHLFDGGYAAGYYGYAWAEVLSADAFSAFEESGLFDPETGRRWRQAVLETGGSRPAKENFIAFRGREPRMDAFLRHHGMLEPQAALG